MAINAGMLAAIDLVIEREHISLTEAVRRLISYGDFIYRAVKEDGQQLVCRSGDGSSKEIVLL